MTSNERNLLKRHARDDEFYVHHKLVRSGQTSLFCKLTNKSKLRQKLIWIVEWKWFDRLITLLILMSTFTLVVRDYSGKRVEFNESLEYVGVGFGVVFAIECAIKIVAHGLVMGQNTYLRSLWNVLISLWCCRACLAETSKRSES
jgi:hypothetical protein